MDGLRLPPAKAVLLAVQLATKADIQTLRTLISQYRKTLHTDLVLRILLSHLPERTEPSEYVPFLEALVSTSIQEDPDHPVDTTQIDELDDVEAKKRVRKLNLLPLRWPSAPEDAPDDPFVLFLIHRSLLIDANTGLIAQLPELLSPFLHHSGYLRTWMISTILPLLRFNYEYHPEEVALLTIPKFEALNDRAGVHLLLSRTGKNPENIFVGRDLRGLVGPWMYGDTLLKRRKLRSSPGVDIPIIQVNEARISEHKSAGWEEVFKWILSQAATSWKTAVDVVEQWDGPGDVDLATYADGTKWLDEDDQLHLERRYARVVLATAYTIPETSEEILNGVQRLLTRIITLLDQDRIPTLQVAASILTPVPVFEHIKFSRKTAKHFREDLLDEDNPLTTPNGESIKLLHALLISAFICTRLRCPIGIRLAGTLVCLQDEDEQRNYFLMLMNRIAHGPKEDDKYWIRMRNELLWLRSWDEEEPSSPLTSGAKGRGIFGCLPKEFIETELLKALLSNTRYSLARSIYETSEEKPLGKEALANTILSSAMSAYDSATNPNKSRGGLKKADDILHAFPNTLAGLLEADKVKALVQVTDSIGQYRLILTPKEPFKPGALRSHKDPISIIGKVLEQNPGSYTSIDKLVDLGKGLVRAGLTNSDDGRSPSKTQEATAEKRVVAMCIDAALSEDDFETAYSYVVTRLRNIAGPAHARTPDLERRQSGLVAEAPPKVIDDWSWRAALQAGKYRRTAQTVRPTHLGNASGNPEIRHLEQRMECLSQALKLAPKATLQEILNVFRRCEEELESNVQQEQKQSEAWDMQGDENSAMPGGFAATPHKSSRATEEAPMTLFDLSRATFGSAMSTIKKNAPAAGAPLISSPLGGPGTEAHDLATMERDRVRKRDRLTNAAVGGLASGVGWLIGANPNSSTNVRDRE